MGSHHSYEQEGTTVLLSKTGNSECGTVSREMPQSEEQTNRQVKCSRFIDFLFKDFMHNILLSLFLKCRITGRKREREADLPSTVFISLIASMPVLGPAKVRT